MLVCGVYFIKYMLALLIAHTMVENEMLCHNFVTCLRQENVGVLFYIFVTYDMSAALWIGLNTS